MTLTERSAQLSDSGISSMDSEDDDTSAKDQSIDSRLDEPAFTMPQAPMPQVPMIRTVKRNKAKRGATMINAPLGEVDLWKHIQVVEIEDNECEEDAEMINYMNDKRGLELAREVSKARMARKREQMLWEKKNGIRRP
jgi:hypothetical protein